MADKLSEEELVWSLNRYEIEVIYWTCKDESSTEIGKKISKHRSTVQTYKTSAYKKLQIDNLLKNKKIPELNKRFCKIVFDIIPTEDDLATYDERRERHFNSSSDILRDDSVDNQIPEEPIIYEPPPSPQIRNRREERLEGESQNNDIAAFIVALFFVVFLAAAVIYSNTHSPIIEPTATSVFANTFLISSTPTLEVTLPTFTLAPIDTPTETPIPTDTPVPIPLPFSDNFTKSYDSHWKVFGGDPVISKGLLLSSSNTPLLMTIGNNRWSDYVVSVSEVPPDVNLVIGNNPWDFYIGLRVQDLNNFIAMKIPNLGYWYIVDNGVWNQIPNSEMHPESSHFSYSNHYTITVKGNEFTAKIDEGEPSYFILPDKYASKFKSGGVLLNVDHVLGIDSFRVSPAP